MRRFNICAFVALALLARSVFGQEAPVADGALPMPPVAAAAPATIDPLPPAPPTPSAEDLLAAKREQLKALLAEIEQLQKGAQPAQIVMKFEVMDISISKMRSIGVDWKSTAGESYLGSGIDGLFDQFRAGPDSGSNDQAASSRVGTVYRSNGLNGFLELLRREGVATVLAAPRLMVLSGQKASIGMNEDVPAPVAALPDSVGKARVGMDLSVAPKLDALGRIQVDFRLKLSRLRDGEPILVDGKPYPRTETREIASSVSLADGQVAILGPWPGPSRPAAPAKDGAEPDARERYLLITASTLKPTDEVRAATLFTPRPLPAQVPPRSDDKPSDKPAKIFNLPYRR